MSSVVVANGIDHWYEEFGDVANPPVLLISGVGGQAFDWHQTFCEAMMSKGLRVIRYDLRDGGLSQRFEDLPTPDMAAIVSGDFSTVSYGVDELADDAAGLLGAIGVESAHIVGQSLGGMIAQALAIRHPSRVRSLTSISSTTGDRSVGQAQPKTMGGQTDVRRSSTDRDVVIDTWMETRRAQFGTGFEFDEALWRTHLNHLYDRGHYPAGRKRQLVAAVLASDRTGALRNLNAPSLVIHGDEDPLIDVSGGYATADAVPNSELLIIGGMGHNMPPEVMSDVATEISELISKSN